MRNHRHHTCIRLRGRKWKPVLCSIYHHRPLHRLSHSGHPCCRGVQRRLPLLLRLCKSRYKPNGSIPWVRHTVLGGCLHRPCPRRTHSSVHRSRWRCCLPWSPILDGGEFLGGVVRVGNGETRALYHCGDIAAALMLAPVKSMSVLTIVA